MTDTTISTPPQIQVAPDRTDSEVLEKAARRRWQERDTEETADFVDHGRLAGKPVGAPGHGREAVERIDVRGAHVRPHCGGFGQRGFSERAGIRGTNVSIEFLATRLVHTQLKPALRWSAQ